MKKLLFLLLICVAGYFGAKFFATKHMLEYATDCDIEVGISARINKPLSTEEKRRYIKKYWSCVEEKKSFVDSIFFKKIRD
mgnify:CR=1 FL=1